MKANAGMAILFAVVFLLLGCEKVSDEQVSKEQKPAMQQYENGWPTFSFSYPSGWESKPVRPGRGEVFGVDAPGGIPSLRASVNPNQPAPLKYFTRSVLPVLSNIGENFEIIEDKAITLKDGTEAWETGLNWDVKNGPALSTLFVTAKKKNMWISVSISTMKGLMSDDMKAIPYSLEVYPGEEDPVALPEDIDRRIDEYANAIADHDLAKVMSFFSDKYLKSGVTKSNIETFYKENINSIPNFKLVVTKCKVDGNKAFIAGYALVSGAKVPFPGETMMRGEDGQWLWIGNQK